MIQVETDNPYPVLIGNGVLADVSKYLGDASRVAIFYPASVSDCALNIAQSIEAEVFSIEIPDGERAKNVQTLDQCWQTLASSGLTRNDLVIGVGGGAATDLAGFVAATYLRGVAYLSVPTTILGMVDAAVGGKTGIDLPQGKNLAGAFHEPRAVFADLDILATLPDREISSGLAEVVKAGFVRNNRILEIIKNCPAGSILPGTDALSELITLGISFKADVVGGDLHERTSVDGKIGRELLNYGHTMGHAIELFENFQMRHGEAISLGMVFAAELSHRLSGLSSDEVALHRELLERLGLPTSYSKAPYAKLREYMSRDKKARGANLRFIGLEAIGKPVLVQAPDEDALAECYEALR